MAEIKKDFIAWRKENSHSSQHANFISDDTYTLDHLRVTMEMLLLLLLFFFIKETVVAD